MATPQKIVFPNTIKVSPPQDPAQSPTRPSMKFRFKARNPLPRSPSHNDQCRAPSRSRSRSPSQHHRHRRHHHHHHRHRRRHHHSRTYSNRRPATPPESAPLSPNRAFRESLFDALADDEGAAFWEGVYGQPIHTYSAYHQAPDSPVGTLERMTEEEYVNYVRAQMWERTHGFMIEERQRRRQKAEADKERRKEEERMRRDWEMRIDEGLKRREERNSGKWRECWERYLSGWQDEVVWPVESGRREDVSEEEVERFFQHAPFSKPAEGSRRKQADNLGALLKAERVRWHPDKVQQRFGSQGIDEATMKAVTAVFQIVDRLWAETR